MKEAIPSIATSTESQVRAVYDQLLSSWNKRDAKAFADLFMDEGYTIGFDGTLSNGKKEIQQHLTQVFQHHQTASYVSIVRSVRALDEKVWTLRADVGMIPPGKDEINPKLNAIQTLMTIKTDQGFRIAHLQNTPAAYHGRPEAVEQLTRELNTIHGK